MLVYSVIVCLVLLGVLNLVAASRLGIGGAMVLALLALFCPLNLAVLSPAVLVSCILLFFLGMGSLGQMQLKTYRRGSVVCVGIGFLFSSVLALSDLADHARLQAKYPMESLSDRLAYETHRIDTSADTLAAAQPMLDTVGLDRLSEVEEAIGRESRPWGRIRNLREVHLNAVQRFVTSPGFGRSRMTDMGESYLTRDADLEPIPIPKAPLPEPDYNEPGHVPQVQAAEGPVQVQVAGTPPQQDGLWKWHVNSITAFLYPEDFGYVRDRDNVAGFRSHYFRGMPFAGFDTSWDGEDEWSITRLELISLLKHPEPRVYVSQNLPRMQDLKDVPTRNLNVFEDRAIRELRQGEDLVVEEYPERVHLVGSLRATTQCLECHHGQRGTLLGAFSYDFRWTRNGERLPQPTEPAELSLVPALPVPSPISVAANKP